ncbi:UDP-glycosyltransferase 89B2 [Vitis vinifera]|uniref:UDP-glycosyltransferase 89B2 n=1 Tax=Vitis vinifera TaxID=29760 RepID=A0A438JYZ9_VITVI|nr:UDP-glycosyltransferase 89B2 [Vitis vinifera]
MDDVIIGETFNKQEVWRGTTEPKKEAGNRLCDTSSPSYDHVDHRRCSRPPLPFYSSGHIIPILDLATKLLSRGLEVTVLVTPSNLPLLDSLLSKYPSSFQSLLGVSHIVFSPSGVLGLSVGYAVWRDRPKNDEPRITISWFPFLAFPIPQVTHGGRSLCWYRNLEDGDPDKEFFRNCMLGNIASWGLVVNTFTELERVYIEAMKKLMGHNRVWAVGPLLPAPEDDDAKRGGSSAVPSHKSSKSANGCVGCCIGGKRSQFYLVCETTGKRDVASESGVIPEGFEDRVGNRGVGIRVAEETRRVPDSTELARILSEAVDGSRPEKVRAMELRDAALSAANGGSSDRDLDDLVERLKELKCEKGTNGHVQGHPISGSTVH